MQCWETAAGITALLVRKLRILIRVAKITCQVALPAAATANTEFYPGTITVSLHTDLMSTFVAGVKNEFFISPMFSQVVEAPGDDRAGEPLKEPWKHDANSLLFLPLGMGRPQVDWCPQGGSGSGEA